MAVFQNKGTTHEDGEIYAYKRQLKQKHKESSASRFA